MLPWGIRTQLTTTGFSDSNPLLFAARRKEAAVGKPQTRETSTPPSSSRGRITRAFRRTSVTIIQLKVYIIAGDRTQKAAAVIFEIKDLNRRRRIEKERRWGSDLFCWALEGEIVRKCLTRTENQCSFVEHRNYKVVYRRYASLFFLVGVDNDENELAILEFIHLLVETMDRHFGNVCELDIMFHLEKAHFMLEEMVMNGCNQLCAIFGDS
ncbi:hypothetical protein MRB53_013463 [Persea americana]|uniref:Uncharacterized protein n=1 Tax=Persea americana TaxID=3435 RepID=A0ACC2K836_PERAE|nr:hypothetical protein MRB53_013463 [Persea americana]